jgi:heme-degrading monooxygenase HmoA
MGGQIVSITFFNYQGFSQKWQALANMGLLPRKIAKVPGLRFFKLMGSGKDGFSIKPNWGKYSLLAIWENKAAAAAYFKSSLFASQLAQCTSHDTHYLRAYQAHGLWDGQQPFELNGEAAAGKPIAVITRATIKTKYLTKFWKDVPQVSQSIMQKEGRIFSIGIGELPLIMQATFSIWKSAEQMKEFAYKSKYHREVVAKTRKLGWYKEEMFARFEVLDV